MSIDVGLLSAFFWGLLGALSYAALKLPICLRDHPDRWGNCILVAVTSIVIGTVFGGVFGPIVASHFDKGAIQDVRAIEVAAGLIANRIAPTLVGELSDRLIDFFAGRSKRGS